MKSITILKFFAILMIISLTTSSLRRRSKNKKNKMMPYDDSDLDLNVKGLAQKMCLLIGRDLTYLFFANTNNYLMGKIMDHEVFDEIWGDTFKRAKKWGSIDFKFIQKNLMKTVEVALGGNTVVEPAAYWKEYSRRMALQNKEYLEGLVESASATKKMKDINDRAELGKNIIEKGVKGTLADTVAEAWQLENIPAMLTEKAIEIGISFIQADILKTANSHIFSSEQAKKNYSAFHAAIVRRNGRCGDIIPSSETGEGGHSPHYDGINWSTDPRMQA